MFAVLKDPANPAGGYTPYYRVIYDSVQSEQLFLDTRNVAVYVQDAWRPTSRLTINAGVRVDNVVRNDRQFSTTVIGAGSNTVGFREEYDLDLDGTFETAFVTPGRTALS